MIAVHNPPDGFSRAHGIPDCRNPFDKYFTQLAARAPVFLEGLDNLKGAVCLCNPEGSHGDFLSRGRGPFRRIHGRQLNAAMIETTPYVRLYTSVLKYLRPESAISVTTRAPAPSLSATRIAAT